MEKKEFYTARLENWKYDGNQKVLIGNIYDDLNQRFKDGQAIMTSRLLPKEMQVNEVHSGSVIRTLNSSYLLGAKG